MYYLNKVVGLLLSPAFVGMAIFLLGFAAALVGRRKLAAWLAGMAGVWFLFWMSPATYRWLATGLEMHYPVQTVEQLPQADAIRILGGGMGANTNEYPYSEMWGSADRVWHGARLYKAGKAARIFVTCTADVPLLLDFGVPREAITVCDKARNTEEEARFIAEAMNLGVEKRCRCRVDGNVLSQSQPPTSTCTRPRVLLVTSAWHMRRAMLMFQRYAPELEIIPAATDYEALVRCGWKEGLRMKDLLPDAEMMFQSSYMIKEIIGYWGYYFLRK